METIDVLVGGGGPGGCAAAIHLARAGLRVTLLEREAHPRFRIGESLLPYGNDLLRELGVWDRIRADGGFMIKRGAEFCTADGAHAQRFSFARGLGADNAFTYQVERSRFDAILFSQAAAEGCVTRERAAITALRPADDHVEVDYHEAGVPRTVRARYFVDATGRDAIAGRLLALSKRATQATRRVATYAHFRGVARNEGETAGNIIIVRAPGGWFWFIPLDAEKTSVGYVRRVADFKAAGLSPGDDFAAAAARFPAIAERLRGAERVGDFHTTGDYSYRFASFAPHPRVMLAGDAAGFVDPIFSSGVMMALKSARLAARLIVARRGGSIGAWSRRRYTADVRRMMDLYGGIIEAFYDDPSFEIFMHPEPIWNLQLAVLAVVGGNTELPWSLRWRLGAFHVFRRVQRWVPLAPRLPSLSECPPAHA